MINSILKIFFTLLIFSNILIAQKNDENLVLIASFEKPNCELLLLQLDNLMVEIQNKPQSFGYVVIYGGENPIDNFFWERAVKNHINFRQFDKNRISVLTTKSNQPLKIEAFIATNGAKPSIKEENFSFALPDEKPILFADDAVTMVKIDKKDTYTGNCAGCCLGPLDLNILAMFLEANLELKAEIKIYNRSKKKADKLTKIILDEIKSENNPSLARLEIKYGGKGNRDQSDSSEISDVKTFLIPQYQ
jgi:hypothetical protein